MEIEHHVLLFHLLEDWVVECVVHDAGGAVGRHAGGIAFHSCDACAFGFDYGFCSHGLVQVQSHQKLHVGLYGLELAVVNQGLFDRGDWRHQVGHLLNSFSVKHSVSGDICSMARSVFRELIIEATYDDTTIDSSIPNRRDDEFHHGPISEVHCLRGKSIVSPAQFDIS